MKVAGGSWLYANTRRGRKWLRREQEQVHEGDGYFQVELDYQVLEHDTGNWRPMKGKVRLEEKSMVKVWATPTNRALLEHVEEHTKERGLPRRQKKMIMNGLQLARQGSVAEVYSVPRVTKVAEENGMTSAGAFDIQTGWDLRDPASAKRMWAELKEKDPDLVVISPPCTSFSPMQNINYSRMDKVMVMCLIADGLHHVQVSMLIARWQWSRKKKFVYEHPKLAKSWEEPEVQEVAHLEGVIIVESHMCMFGLRVGEGLNKKPTWVMTNCREIASTVRSWACTPTTRRRTSNKESTDIYSVILSSLDQRIPAVSERHDPRADRTGGLRRGRR